jgi:hypothetical protein
MQPEHLLLAIAAAGTSNDPMRIFTNLALINDSLPGPAKALVANQAIATADQVAEERTARVLSTVAARLLQLDRQGKLDRRHIQKALPGISVIMAAQELAAGDGQLPEASLVDVGARAYANARPMLGLMVAQRSAIDAGNTNTNTNTNGHSHGTNHGREYSSSTSVYECIAHDEEFRSELLGMVEQGLLKTGALQKFPYFQAILKRVAAEADGDGHVDGTASKSAPIGVNGG